MGENFLKAHPWSDYDCFREIVQRWWKSLEKAGITVGSYQPKKAE
jgi:hypothetical protein